MCASSRSHHHAGEFANDQYNICDSYIETTNIGEIFTGVSSTGFLAGSSRLNGLDGTLEDIAQFKGLDEITDFFCVLECVLLYTELRHVRVPDHASILDANIVVTLVDCTHLLDTLVER